MRIKKLEIHNINSLKGRWVINFEDENYKNSGLFAITGPTGAGKSTILDGISLALYGETPRVKDISKTSNEVMNKESAEASAVLELESNSKFYRASWGQRRARGKLDGALQQTEQRLEVFEPVSENWVPLANKIKEMAPLITEVTGLEYSQFRRSVLLAQGDFAAFLRAKPTEKAEILEQVTGTEEYRNISVRVFERSASEKKKTQDLDLQLKEKKILSPEDRQTKETLLVNLNNTLKDLTEKQRETEILLGWRKDLDDKADRLKSAEMEKEKLDARSAEMVNIKDILETYQKAQELTADYALISQKRSELRALEEKMPSLRQTITKLEADEERLIGEHEEAGKRFESKKTENEELSKLLKKIRELDVYITTKKTSFNEAEQRVRQLNAHSLKLLKKINQNEKDIQNKEAEKKNVEKWLSENKNAKVLFEKKDILTTAKTKAESISAENKETHKDLAGKEKEITDVTSDLAKVSAELESEKTAIETINASIQEKKACIQRLLNGKDLEEYEHLIEELKDKLTKSSVLKDHIERALEVKEKIDQKSRDIKNLERETENACVSLNQQKDLINSLEGQIKNLQDLSCIEDLTVLRAQLEEGKECPLCGSKIHPFAVELPKGVINAKNEKDKVEEKLRIAEHGKLEFLKTISRLEGILKSSKEQKEAEEKGLRELTQKINFLASELAVREESDLRFLENIVFSLEGDLSAEKKGFEKIKKEVGVLKREENQLSSEFSEKQTQFSSKLNREGQLRGHLEQAKKRRNELENKAKESSQKWAELISLSTLKLSEGLVQAFTGNSFIEELVQLQDKGSKYGEKAEELKKIENELALIELDRKKNSEAYSQTIQELGREEKNKKEKQNELEQVTLDRRKLFGEKDPAVEEERAQEELKLIEQNFVGLQNSKRKVESELIKNRTGLKSVEDSQNNLNQTLSVEEAQWQVKLVNLGFVGEDSWRESLLSEKEKKSQQKILEDYEKAVYARRKEVEDLKKEVQVLQEQNKTQLTLPQLEEQKAAEQQSISESNKEIGAVQEELKHDDSVREEAKILLEKIKKQSEEAKKWERLNALIGQKDGSKFQRFVQSLTLETLITRTNRVLSRLSTRYLLIKNQESPLDLDVVDNEMDELVRATANLSGGESFIVSLALALGLSELTSNKIRIDSLFLDEGFGSLDEESLDKALNALANLNSFNQRSGHQKLIGVISHVGQIHERIPVQISVTPQPGGSSVLKGPGVTRRN